MTRLIVSVFFIVMFIGVPLVMIGWAIWMASPADDDDYE